MRVPTLVFGQVIIFRSVFDQTKGNFLNVLIITDQGKDAAVVAGIVKRSRSVTPGTLLLLPLDCQPLIAAFRKLGIHSTIFAIRYYLVISIILIYNMNLIAEFSS